MANSPESSPLPQPSGITCSNCGAAQNAGTQRCSNCGAVLAPVRKSGLSVAAKIFLSLAVLVGAVGFGVFGACLISIGAGDAGYLYGFIGLVVLGALACIWAIFRGKS